MDLIQDIELTTTVNPHLFWIIENNEERKKILKNLEQQLEDAYKTQAPKLNHSFEIGEIVAVRINKKLCRAVIELSYMEKNSVSTCYTCWLVDYGFMIETESVFKLSSALRKTPALALQASLNNVTYFEQLLTYNSSGEPTMMNTPIKTPTPNCRQDMLEVLSESESLQLKLEKKLDGIMFGDILFKDSLNREKSLREVLIEKRVLQMNKEVFEEISESIHDYKERNVKKIIQICKSNRALLDRMIRVDEVEVKQEELVRKYLTEFYSDEALHLEEDEFSLELLSHRSRSRLDNTSSSLDLSSASESETPKPKVCALSKRKRLLETMILYRNSKANTKSQENSPTSNHVEEIKVKSPEGLGGLRAKLKMLLEERKKKGSVGDKNEATHGTPKTIAKRKITLTPAGSERSFSQSTKKKNYRSTDDHSSTQYSSDYSECTRNSDHKQKSPNNVIEDHHQTLSQSKNSSAEIVDSEIQSSPTEEDSPKESMDTSEQDDKTSLSAELKQWDESENRVSTLNIKPHCSCKQCEQWTNDEHICLDTFKPKTAKIIEGDKQVLFKKDNDKQNDVSIISLDYSSISKIEKQAMTKLLVHSESIPNPVNLISKVSFHQCIHRSLVHLDYREAKRIQSYAWPAVFRNQHVCMVHGPQTGKTMAYLPVMCTFILEKTDRYESLLNISGGPIVVVLCNSSKKCEEVYDLSKILFGKSRAKVHLFTYPLKHSNVQYCDLLVTTPAVLDELLKTKTVNFKRLCHLILEDGDKLLDRHHVLLSKVFDLLESVLKHRVYSKAIQLVICAEHWTTKMCRLLKSLQQVPIVCIGNYLEAALYGKMEFSMRFINSACKEVELKALLKESYRIHRSIVVCKEDEIDDIETILMLKGIDSVVIKKDMKKEDILYMEDVWTQAKGGQYTVLVCSDFILNTVLTVTCASLLIHYSLPNSWTKFVKRFSCLLENCKSPLDAKEARIVSKSVVLCDESCEAEMHKFFSYINSTELKSQLPEKLQKYSQELRRIEEEEKLENAIGVCNDLKLFGKCGENRCARRHIVSEALDISNYLPKCGRIKFKIIHVQDVTSFSIVLLQHVDGDGKMYDNYDALDVTEDLSDTLRISRKKIHKPVIGHRYAFHDLDEQEGVYYRCELMEIDNDCVKIKLLDKGTTISTMNTRIYRLPNEFSDANKPRAVIDAYLANYIPPFDDENFSARSFFDLKNLLEKHDYKNIIFTADVHLQLSNALWLKNVYEEVTLSDRVVPGFQLSREILRKNLVVYSNDHLYNLYKLCVEAGIELPTYERKHAVAVPAEEKVVPQWAFLDAEQPEEVIFLSAISPEEIYVRLNKYSDLLYNMQKEIQKVIKKPHYPKLCDVKIGGVYLAKDPEGLEFSRALVLNKDDDKALCFFVDFGDEAVIPTSELAYLQSHYITRLPFQSIQCRLCGIRPISEEWDSDITNILYDYATEPHTDIFRSLFVKVCQKDTSHIAGQKKYSVLLKDGFGDKKVLINQLFIECGLAIASCEVIEDFELPAFNIAEPNEEIEEAIEICKTVDELDMSQGRADCQPDDFELFFDEQDKDAEMKFFDQILKFMRIEKPAFQNRELPPITAAPPSDYYTPEVFWSQTEKTVKMSIRLTDVVDYKLTLTKARILNFKTVKDERTFSLKLILYETVDSMQHTSPGPDVRITLTKMKAIDWPRLILAKQRTRNIHYDLTTIKVEEKRKKFLELPEELRDDESDDDVIDVMYHVESDLDSDLDVELAQDSD